MSTNKDLLINKTLEATVSESYFKTSIESTKSLSQIQISITTKDIDGEITKASFTFDENEDKYNDKKVILDDENHVKLLVENDKLKVINEATTINEINKMTLNEPPKENNKIVKTFTIGDPIFAVYIHKRIIVYDLATN